MAKLSEMANLMNVDLKITHKELIKVKEKSIGRKRRTWLMDDSVDEGSKISSPSPIPHEIQKIDSSKKYDEITELDKKNDKIKTQIRDKPKTNRRQTEDKLETNRGQTEDKPRTEEEEGRQTEDKLGTQLGTQLETKLETNWRQTEDKLETKFIYSSLVGLQKNILLLIHEECHFLRSDITHEITLDYLSRRLETSINSIKKTIQRLEHKGFLKREKFKAGRGGWTKYKLPKSVFEEILKSELNVKPRTNWRQTEDKLGTQPSTQPRTSPPSSSSLNINTTTEDSEGLKNRFSDVDIDSLSNIKFTENHLQQLSKLESLTLEIMQSSVDHFAFDLQHNGKGKEIKKDPISFFMAIMRRDGVYNAPSNYESKKERALVRYLEAKKIEQARLKSLLGDDYILYRNSSIRDIYKNLPSNTHDLLLEGFKSAGRLTGVDLTWFKDHGLDHYQVWPLFCEWVSKTYGHFFKEVKSFEVFCDEKTHRVSEME